MRWGASVSEHIGLIIAAVGSILAAAMAGVFGAAWLNRRNLARLTAAQATQTEAGTTEVVDRIAREWLNRLESTANALAAKVTRLEAELEHEVRVRRGAIAFIERLLDWINDRHPHDQTLPQIPDDLTDYLLDPIR